MPEPIEEIYGKRAQSVVGKLIMSNHGEVPIADALYPKIMVGGVVFGEPVGEKGDKLYVGGFSFLTDKRHNHKLLGYTIGQIVCTPNWDKVCLGEELPKRNCYAVGKIISRYMGTQKMDEDTLEKYLLAGVVFGNSLADVGNQEIWGGTLIVTPNVVYRRCDDLRGLTIDQAITSPFWHDPERWEENVFNAEENKPLIDCFLD